MIVMAKEHSTRKGGFFFSFSHQQIVLKLLKCYIWSIALYGAETCTLRKVDQEYLQSFEMCC